MSLLYVKYENSAHTGSPQLVATCPFCGSKGTFHGLGGDFKVGHGATAHNFGFKFCPNEDCRGILAAVYKNGQLMRTYPGLSLGINTEAVPARIAASFQEAELCFANNCFTASAMMLRKTLEEICLDKKADGVNLFKKIEAIIKETLLPQPLAEAMHELRLLGNDAAHVESQSFENIGSEELKVSIEFTQEIVKGIYQYDSLLARMRGLKAKKE
jgi:hypothetical protein